MNVGARPRSAVEQIGAQHAALAHVGPHQRHEIDERGAASGGGDLDAGVAVGARAGEREGDLRPRRSTRRQRAVGQHRPVRGDRTQ